MKACALAGLVILSLLVALSPALAVIYVKSDSIGSVPDGNGWDTAYHTIREAVDAAEAAGGDEIWVAEGVYREAVTLAPSVHLFGGFAGDETLKDQRNWRSNLSVIDGGSPNQTPVAVTGADSSTLDGFVIANAATGIYCENAATTIANNTIKRNSIGVDCQNSAAVITGNTVMQNTYDGITLFECSATVAGNRIIGDFTGISCCRNSPSVVNNIIMGCYTGIKSEDSSAAILNNTLARCNDGISVYKGSPNISNNIIAYSKFGVARAFTTWTFQGNNLYADESFYGSGRHVGSGAIPGDPADTHYDPLFASLEYGDLHIQPASGCRNTGSMAVSGLPEVDFEGQNRAMDGTVDIGADESDGIVRSAIPRRVYVNASASNGGDGAGWPTAYNTLQAAIDDVEAQGPAELWVAAGTYHETITLWPFALLYGGFTGSESARDQRNWRLNPTVIDAGGADYAVIGASLAGVDGFTISNSVAGVYSERTSPTITNCTISDNDYGLYCVSGFPVISMNSIIGNRKDGMFFEHSFATVGSNNIMSNAGYGANLTMDSTGLSFGGNVFSHNFGGLLCYGSSPSIINNTIVDNQGTGISTVYNSIPVVTNNIVAFNDKGIVKEPNPSWLSPFVSLPVPALSRNDVYGNTTQYSQVTPTNDINLDPLFVDRASGNYHIQPQIPDLPGWAGSPCMNAGTNPWAYWPTPPIRATPTLYDMDGQARVPSPYTPIDIGADEYMPWKLTVLDGTYAGRTDEGVAVPISAGSPPSGMVFDRWIGDTVYVADVNSPNTTITMHSDATVTATYKWIQYTLTVNNGTGSGIYNIWTEVPIAADAAPAGQVFDRWTGDTTDLAGISSGSTTITMNADATVTANYKWWVSVDILPGVSPNRINLKSQGLISVAILTTTLFDAASVDPATVTLAGVLAATKSKDGKLHYERADVNGDGNPDLLLRFDTQSLLLSGATSATLRGKTLSGYPLEGEDGVVIVSK